MWQPKPSDDNKQRFMHRQTDHATTENPNMHCPPFWHAHYIHPHCRDAQCISWSSIMIWHVFLLFFKPTGYQTLNITTPATPTTAFSKWPRLDIPTLQEAVRRYLGNGITPTTKRTYVSRIQRYIDFCTQTKCLSIPASENTLLLFVVHLAMQQLSHTSIKVYLSAVCNLHITSGNHHHITLTPQWHQKSRLQPSQPGLDVPSQQSLCYKSTPSCHNNHTATMTS